MPPFFDDTKAAVKAGSNKNRYANLVLIEILAVMAIAGVMAWSGRPISIAETSSRVNS